MDHFNYNSVIGTVTNEAPFGTATTNFNHTTDSTIGGVTTGSANLGGTYHFPSNISSGSYMINYIQSYTTGGHTSWTPSMTLTNASPLNLMFNNSSSEEGQIAANSDDVTNNTFIGFCTVTASPATIKITSVNNSGNAINNADLYISLIPTPSN